MYICIYVYMYICIYVYMYTCIHVYMYTCIHVYMYICIYVYMYICIYVYMYIYIYVYMYICICICICCICMYIHIYMYICVKNGSKFRGKLEDSDDMLRSAGADTRKSRHAPPGPRSSGRPPGVNGQHTCVSYSSIACTVAVRDLS